MRKNRVEVRLLRFMSCEDVRSGQLVQTCRDETMLVQIQQNCKHKIQFIITELKMYLLVRQPERWVENQRHGREKLTLVVGLVLEHCMSEVLL